MAWPESGPTYKATNLCTQLQVATTITGKVNQADILLHFLFPRSWKKEKEKEEKEEKEDY